MLVANREAVLVRSPGIPMSHSTGSRTRRRGPRSREAVLRRSHAHPVVSQEGVGSCLAESSSSSSTPVFSFLQCNIRGFVSHRAELESLLRTQSSSPQLICLNETFLDESVIDIHVGGYKLISRRDRCDGRLGGGIACFAQDDIAEQVIFLEHSVDDERSWHTLLTDIGPVLCGVWYRPPCAGEIQSIHGCETEWKKFSESHVASVLVGDVNVHHKHWLRFSSSTSVEGTALFRFCSSNGLTQCVKQPTRDEHLLDLIIADVLPHRVAILPSISDHKLVLADFCFGVTESEHVARTVFDYAKADWVAIRKCFHEFDWRSMDNIDVNDAERFLHRNIFAILERYVPQKQIFDRKTAHPWINDRCVQAVRTKHEAIGTPGFLAAATRCNSILFEEYLQYVQHMRDRLRNEKRGSKLWWKLANEIMDKDVVAAPIPALQSSSGEWINDSCAKSCLLADHFRSKFVVPPIESNEFSVAWPVQHWDGFVPIRVTGVAKVLAQLDADSGTGPDGLSTRVLKVCAQELAVPLAKLVRRIVVLGLWPSEWLVHWLMPLHKRKAKSCPANYRAINLTAQISKAVERLMTPMLTPSLEPAFGTAQFAYRKDHGARDAVLYYVLSWIASLNEGDNVGVYCSDVAGAFDRVDTELLLRKLSSLNLNIRVLRVVRSWLRDRKGFVIVRGTKSHEMILRNMVFQGTVWGPSLWNVFFGDCVCAVQCLGFDLVIYADDCNTFKAFPRALSNDLILTELQECQLSLHKWGRANGVTFDAGKEEMMIISNVAPHGGPAKLLGIEFDNKLIMASATHKCARKAAWKTKSLLRVRRFYTVLDLVGLYKSHVLSYIEYRTAGVHFASTSVLNGLDDVQRNFLRQLDLNEIDAFMSFNVAPLCVRRDIAVLGVIHRAALREGPPQLWKFFIADLESRRDSRTVVRHAYQLVEWPAGRNLEVMRRSALGMIRVYNLLPEDVVVSCNVKSFQKALTQLVRDRVVARDDRWKYVLSCRHQLFQHHPLLC